MPKKKPIAVNVEPSVLKWLIDSSGWTREEIAKRLKTTPQNVEKMESGDKKPSFRQLKSFLQYSKDPSPHFFYRSHWQKDQSRKTIECSLTRQTDSIRRLFL